MDRTELFDRMVQFGQNRTIWTKLDNSDKIGQVGQSGPFGQNQTNRTINY